MSRKTNRLSTERLSSTTYATRKSKAAARPSRSHTPASKASVAARSSPNVFMLSSYILWIAPDDLNARFSPPTSMVPLPSVSIIEKMACLSGSVACTSSWSTRRVKPAKSTSFERSPPLSISSILLCWPSRATLTVQTCSPATSATAGACIRGDAWARMRGRPLAQAWPPPMTLSTWPAGRTSALAPAATARTSTTASEDISVRRGCRMQAALQALRCTLREDDVAQTFDRTRF